MHYRFDRYELLEPRRELRRDGQPLHLGARAFDVLLVLLSHADRVVTKAELLDRVWPGAVVEENNLQVQISTLRKLLGERAIATIPRRGYRFTLPLTDAATAPPTPAGLPAQRAAPGNLPAALPPIIGREAEQRMLAQALQAQVTVSIVATGGVGKTHLARAVAAQWRSGERAVWWVDLAALRHPALVAPTLARALGVQEAAGHTPEQTVADALRDQDGLLLLDNCEHLLPAVVRLVEQVRAAAPRLRLLITSQQALKTADEWVYRLDTLPLPHGDALPLVARSTAVQLFVQRVQALQPGFALDAGNAAAVAQLCRRLDGIPLALELAAARVPLLGLGGLAERLDQRLQLLRGHGRRGLSRHDTLQAALAFSHGLLSPDEQAVYRRLGVFAGSFSSAAAQAVAADAQVDAWAVLDHLAALVDKSMLLLAPGDTPRLRLLETTRAHALHCLAEAGETAAVQARHAQAIAAQVAAMAQDYWAIGDAEMRARCEPDHDNLHVAIAWALAHDPALAVRLVGDAGPLWREALSQQPEGARYCEAALACVRADTPALDHGRLLHTQAWMLIWSQQRRARSVALRAAELLRGTPDTATLGMTLLLLIPGTTRPDATQEAALAELQRLHSPQAAPRVRVQLLSASARLAMGAGRYDEALQLYGQARELLDGCGAVQWAGVLAWTMAGIAMTLDDLDFAVDTLRQTADRLDAQPVRGIFLAFALGSLATALLLRGDTAAARAALARAAPLIVRYDLGFRYAATAAGLAAAEQRWFSAARLMGYGESARRASGVDAEEPAELRVRARTDAALQARPEATALASARGAGRLLDTAGAFGVALGQT
ncbi:winged helix-turn-helix domain-containing protein [Ideonella sp. DXS22W]|uniref:Winged helix-turn-helix domain-containing protein n=1 Tax=Pseudaquabacterium inlustre TaxID=2984192 RepID=A0ABU9CMU9_9BURK